MARKAEPRKLQVICVLNAGKCRTKDASTKIGATFPTWVRAHLPPLIFQEAQLTPNLWWEGGGTGEALLLPLLPLVGYKALMSQIAFTDNDNVIGANTV